MPTGNTEESKLASLGARYVRTVDRIRECESEYSRPAGSVKLVAAAKYADSAQILFLHRECGLDDFGENRVQTLLEHYAAAGKEPGIRFHFIGTLQKNKVKQVIGKVCLIHSLDSAGLADEIERRAAAAGQTVRVLIEINSGDEPDKSGVGTRDAAALAGYVSRLGHLSLDGFMTMGPKFDTDRERRDNFARFAALARSIWKDVLEREGLPYLSMGMSDSFPAAIAEGADCVRIGRSLFADEY